MFTEGQLYAPVVTSDGGEVVVELGHDHPGVGDPAYRERRNALAALALGWDEAGRSPSPTTPTRSTRSGAS